MLSGIDACGNEIFCQSYFRVLYDQFSYVLQWTGDFAEKLIKG